jgi:hypothetical protein
MSKKKKIILYSQCPVWTGLTYRYLRSCLLELSFSNSQEFRNAHIHSPNMQHFHLHSHILKNGRDIRSGEINKSVWRSSCKEYDTSVHPRRYRLYRFVKVQ